MYAKKSTGSGSFKNEKQQNVFTNHIYKIYMYKNELAYNG